MGAKGEAGGFAFCARYCKTLVIWINPTHDTSLSRPDLGQQIEALSARAFFLPLLRPLLGSGITALLLSQLHPLLVNFLPLLRLAVEVASGGIAYVGGITIMRLLARRPKGAEAYLLKNILPIRG